MVATTGTAISWVFIYVLIYWLFLKRDGKGERYLTGGCTLLLINSFAGYFMVDELTSFIAVIITGIYFLNTHTTNSGSE